MRIKLIGSAAGGGVPQWNCNYRYSRAAREGDRNVLPRLQSSIACSANERDWVLFNASPDLRQQIAQTPELQPKADAPLRSSPIAAVVITNADVDHIAGLLNLRERQPFTLYATRRILSVLDDNPIFRVLDPAYVTRIPVELGHPFAVAGPNGPTGLQLELYPVPGKVALFLETGGGAADFEADGGDTVGVAITRTSGTGRADYVPGCARIDPPLRDRLSGTDLLLFDGTVFADEEMSSAGVGTKTGRRMGHLPIDGEDGSLKALAGLDAKRRVYVHINNTNPILDRTSPERRIVEAAGWEVGEDGLDVTL